MHGSGKCRQSGKTGGRTTPETTDTKTTDTKTTDRRRRRRRQRRQGPARWHSSFFIVLAPPPHGNDGMGKEICSDRNRTSEKEKEQQKEHEQKKEKKSLCCKRESKARKQTLQIRMAKSKAEQQDGMMMMLMTILCYAGWGVSVRRRPSTSPLLAHVWGSSAVVGPFPSTPSTVISFPSPERKKKPKATVRNGTYHSSIGIHDAHTN